MAESLGEARLFVQALLEEEARTPPERPIEGLCVSTDEALRRLLSAPTSDVVVIPMNNDVRELADRALQERSTWRYRTPAIEGFRIL